MTPPPREFAKRAYLDVALPTSRKAPIEELPPGLVEELAEQFLARYAHRADDFSLYALVDYFAGCRAAIRAKVALKHLTKRERSGRDASDAGPAFYRWSVENLQPPTEWPRESLIAIATDDPKWRAGLSSGIH